MKFDESGKAMQVVEVDKNATANDQCTGAELPCAARNC